jgi:hypothetical protein
VICTFPPRDDYDENVDSSHPGWTRKGGKVAALHRRSPRALTSAGMGGTGWRVLVPVV